MDCMKEFVVSRSEAGQRFDRYIAKILKNAPVSFHYKMLRKKNIILNEKKAKGTEKIVEGDVVKFFLSEETFEKFAGKISQGEPVGAGKRLDFRESGLKVLYEDEDILAFLKPAGILSQKAEAEDVSVNDYLAAYLKEQEKAGKWQPANAFTPSICNRLDRNTSGIILCGKSMTGARELGAMLKNRSLKKYYRCLVLGRVEAETLTGYLYKEEKTNKIKFSTEFFADSDKIKTAWEPVETVYFGDMECTVLNVHLITGKTHQIRGHLAGIGHPIIGDYKYGDRKVNDAFKQKFGLTHQLLHAYMVVFPEETAHMPKWSGLVIKAGLPEMFQKILKSGADSRIL